MADFEPYEQAIRKQLAKKPERLKHSLGVASTARHLALAYGVDADAAYVAGLLHDWGKAYSHEQSIERAKHLGIKMGDDASLVSPLLHGPIAARELRELFPELDSDVLQAIERHTIAASDMTELDMLVFVADAIEPGRTSTPDIEDLRNRAGNDSLDEVFWRAFKGSVAFVIKTGRYLYPGTLDIYNQIVVDRQRKETA